MNITLKNGIEVVPYETLFAMTDGVLFYADEPNRFDDTVTLYPEGAALRPMDKGDIEIVPIVEHKFDDNGNVTNIGEVIEELDAMGIAPFTISIKKLRKWVAKEKVMVIEPSDIGCADCPECQAAKEPKQKPDVVRVVRYLREQTFTPMGNGYHVETNNMSGMTIVADLDYKNQHIVVYWSDCRGDNFDKSLGQELALASKPLVFPMYHGAIPDCGLVEYITHVVYDLVICKDCKDKALNKFYRHLSRYQD